MNLDQTLKQNKTLFIILLIIFGLLFSWFEVRPSLIKRSCMKWAYQQGSEYINYAFLQNEPTLKKSQLQEEYMDRAYNRCLHEKGLE